MSDGRAAALVALAVALAVVAPAGAVGPPEALAPAEPAGPVGAQVTATDATEISGCTAITSPGEYVLAGNVTDASPARPRTGLGACIAIRADDVTLRGGGHVVAANETGAPGVVGVLVGGRERRANVTVRNLAATRWGAGVAVRGATGATLWNVSARNNLGDGIFVEGAPEIEIRGGTVAGSNTGVFVRDAPDASLAGLDVTDNLVGVSVRNADGAAVERVRIDESSQYGLGVFASANATVADATLRDDGFAHVVVSRADGVDLRNLTIGSESETQPRSGGASAAQSAGTVGVYLNDSTGVRLADVSVADAPGTALYAVGNSSAVGERVSLGGTRLAFEVRDVALDAAADAPPLPLTERRVVGAPLRAVPTGEGARLSLSVGYDEAAIERASTTEDALSLWRFDPGEGWRRVGSAVGAEANAASATFGNLSENGTVVALVGEGLAEAEDASARDRRGGSAAA
ncbi:MULTISPECIES: right-handed parallel beta-helix repeat-containing protein [Halorussus]|uniref:right-handed parallel beta-helix repeat-containing protein n=1 Tax=Halorussus TaxID=1070314 RepID=UPI000E21201A|nr:MULTISPECIES: right-handed parallel beta-helix repeat-containing protein [Halorussus]NHN60386.1 right-handed parallel beta-helix repeat-containing protein [Halorussus sp. JP-T4]